MATTTMTGGETAILAALRGSRGRRRKEFTIRVALFVSAGLSVVISAAIVLALIGEAIGFLTNIDLGWLVSDGWFPRRNQFDMLTIFTGSMMITIVAMAVAVPLGLGAAIYLSEYARPRVRRSLKPVLETLAGIPSVVMGFFALTIINPTFVQSLFGATSTFTVAAAGIGVGILTVPLIASVAEDAMFAVPNAMREAAYGIGARRRTVTMRVVFPAAVSGIVAAVILGISRAIGETMVVSIAAGGTGGSLRTFDIFGPGQTMTGAISSLAIGSDQVRGAEQAFNSLYFVGLNLFVMTFVLNLISERFVRRVRRNY
jgi:phosphate transport system permease protein